MAAVSASITSSGFDVAADVKRVQDLVATLPGKLAQVAADTGAAEVIAQVVAIRGSLSMSNNAQAGGLEALPIVRSGSPHAEAEIQAVPLGVWKLINDGAAPHDIRVKRGRRALLGGGKRAMPTTYGLFSHVHHPGTSGDQSWDRAMAAAEPAIDEAVRAAFDEFVAPVVI